ncbi:glycosyltransferase [Epibacterium sp. SM1979]|uniref:Glycosyltransferase n=2 Tax=Tritonibacter litoralis TaxID=2662264 RepID=A0A843YIF8_9RHOB|nr:glycosyltransferase [Tritonibacter litoralis]
MKSPNHPVPSGDREMARNLMRMMECAGCTVTLVSDLRCRDKAGDAEVQAQLLREAEGEVAKLTKELAPFDLWVTYHNYYKAPDLIGPRLTQARGVPYVQIESTRALKRLGGPWDQFARAAHAAADHADLILSLTERDQKTLIRDRFAAQALNVLPPFLSATELPHPSTLQGPMLSAGMMRPGDKLASYQLIADTLRHLDGDWQLDIAGDGPAQPDVRAMMAQFGGRVRFLGQLSRGELAQKYQTARLFLWPGVNEAFGMVYLEAQAFGLPIIAQNRPGVSEVLSPLNHARTADVTLGPKGLVDQIKTLSPSISHKIQTDARRFIEDRHLLPAAAEGFLTAITPLLEQQL